MTSYALIPKTQPQKSPAGSKPQLMPKPSPLPFMNQRQEDTEKWQPLGRPHPSTQRTDLNPNRGFNRYDPKPVNTADRRVAERTRQQVEAERALRQQELQELANARSVVELEEERSRMRQAQLREERARELQELAQHMRTAPKEKAADINKVTGQERVEAERQMRQQELEVMTQARAHAELEEEDSNKRHMQMREERTRELQQLAQHMKTAPMEPEEELTKIAGQERIEAERQLRQQELEEMKRARAMADLEFNEGLRGQAKLKEERARELHELAQQMRSGMTERDADINRMAGQERVEAERQMRQQELEAMTRARAEAELEEEESHRRQLQLKDVRAKELHELTQHMQTATKEKGTDIDKMTGQERMETERHMRQQELEAMTRARANVEPEELGDSAKRAQQLREERYRELQQMTQLMKLDGNTEASQEAGGVTGQERVLSERQLRQKELEEVARCRAQQEPEEDIKREIDPRQERMKELHSISEQLKGSLGLKTPSQIESEMKTVGDEQREQEQEARRLELEAVARARASGQQEKEGQREAEVREAMIREERQRELQGIREGNKQDSGTIMSTTASHEDVEAERQKRHEELNHIAASRVQLKWERTTVVQDNGKQTLTKEKESRQAVFV